MSVGKSAFLYSKSLVLEAYMDICVGEFDGAEPSACRQTAVVRWVSEVYLPDFIRPEALVGWTRHSVVQQESL